MGRDKECAGKEGPEDGRLKPKYMGGVREGTKPVGVREEDVEDRWSWRRMKEEEAMLQLPLMLLCGVLFHHLFPLFISNIPFPPQTLSDMLLVNDLQGNPGCCVSVLAKVSIGPFITSCC